MAADRQDGRPVLPVQQHKQELAAFSLGVPTNPVQASKMLQAWSASADPGEPGLDMSAAWCNMLLLLMLARPWTQVYGLCRSTYK